MRKIGRVTAGRAGRQRQNIVVILSDDQQARALGAAGNTDVRTPHLDRLAREGTRFSQCYISNPICTPSRAALLTGQYGFRNGVTFFWDFVLPEAPAVAKLLANAGYSTGFVGKWHLNCRPCDYGFTHMRHVFLEPMHSYDCIPVVQGANDPPEVIQREPTELFTDGAIELLDGVMTKPFALFLWYTAPHDPRTPPARCEALYDPDKLSLPPNFMPEPKHAFGTLKHRDERLLPRPLDSAAVKLETARYYGLITHLDEQIGRLLEHLEERGLADNTLVVFASDNGLFLGSHGLLGKQVLYEEAVRVPLIFRGPRVRAGQTSDALVDLIDVAPTLCDAARVAVPSSVQGRSLKFLLRGRKREHRRAVYSHYYKYYRMIRTRRYKLIVHLQTGREEFFDLEADPFEMNDLAGAPGVAAAQDQLRRQLEAWREEQRDPDFHQPPPRYRKDSFAPDEWRPRKPG